jgi:nitroreductase
MPQSLATSLLPNSESKDHLARVMCERRTINFFQPDKVSKEVVLNAIDCARWAPNHHLTEPWHFYLLSDDTSEAVCNLNAELVAQRKGQDAAEKKRERWRKMPGWLVVTCDRHHEQQRYMEDYAAVCAAVQNLSLYLWADGVGMKWTTGAVTRDSRFYETLWIDAERELVVGLFWYGYPAEIPATTRKPVEQIVVDV